MINPTVKSIVRIETDTVHFFRFYPHLREIKRLWGNRECRDILVGLMFDNRNGARRGFPEIAVKTILNLLEEHDRHFPELADRPVTDQWHALGGHSARH